jgi:glutaryl-CoA dehydrogenase
MSTTEITAAATNTACTTPLRIQDFLDLDMPLSNEEGLIRDAVPDFVRRELASQPPGAYQPGWPATRIAPALGKLGLLGMHLDNGCTSLPAFR